MKLRLLNLVLAMLVLGSVLASLGCNNQGADQKALVDDQKARQKYNEEHGIDPPSNGSQN